MKLKRLVGALVPERIPWFAADMYGQIAATTFTSYYQRVSSEIVAEVNCGRILDIGTGPGYLPIEIARKTPAITIDGIDLSKKMTQMATRNAEEAGVSARVHFEVGNANGLRFDDNSYDMVISTGAFHAWKKPVRVLNECWRVLKPGGEAWIYDPAGSSSEGLRQERKLTISELIALKWGSLTSRIAAPYTLEQAYAIVRASKFKHYEAQLEDGLRIRLRK